MCKLMPNYKEILREKMEGKEILAVVDSVSSEKGLEKDVIFVAMELAIASAHKDTFMRMLNLLLK